MTSVYTCRSPVVRIQVGDTSFYAHRQTLLNSESIFCQTVTDDPTITELIVHRDPKMFRWIMNFINGYLFYPTSSFRSLSYDDLTLLLQETVYYETRGFYNQVHMYLYPMNDFNALPLPVQEHAKTSAKSLQGIITMIPFVCKRIMSHVFPPTFFESIEHVIREDAEVYRIILKWFTQYYYRGMTYTSLWVMMGKVCLYVFPLSIRRWIGNAPVEQQSQSEQPVVRQPMTSPIVQVLTEDNVENILEHAIEYISGLGENSIINQFFRVTNNNDLPNNDLPINNNNDLPNNNEDSVLNQLIQLQHLYEGADIFTSGSTTATTGDSGIEDGEISDEGGT